MSVLRGDDNEDVLVVSGHVLWVVNPGHRQQATVQFLAERRLETTPPGFEAQHPATTPAASIGIRSGAQFGGPIGVGGRSWSAW
jgi:hypothetical protein